jgi:hypothetical protein
MHAVLVVLLAASPAQATAPAPAAVEPPAVAAPAPTPADEWAKRSLSDWLTEARKSLPTLGVYRFNLVGEERVEGKLQAEQEIDFTIREVPLAAFLSYKRGPGKGRLVYYDSATRKNELRARDNGFVGVFGGFWLDINGKLARSNTAHGITESGFGATLTLLEQETQKALPFGGLSTLERGLDATGAWCMNLKAPEKGVGLYASTIKVCFDTRTALPTELVLHDGQGLKEKYLFRTVEPNVLPEGSFLSLQQAGL